MDKKGTHVGVVISFIMFVMFLLFLYTLLLNPIFNKESKDVALDNLKTLLIENLSDNLTTTSVNIDQNDGNKCISLQNFFTATGLEDKLNVRNSIDSTQSAYTQSNNLVIDRNTHNDVFFRIYSSKNFNQLTSKSGCKQINEGQYSIGLLSTEKLISPSKVKTLVDNYKSNYYGVESNFGILAGDEFSFTFIYANKTVISPPERNITTSIYSREIPVRYFDSNANVSFGTLRIKVW